ncbi:hypothetical protein L0Z72_10935, partial [candidate division KSB1 bacterium]|nr:hypothetical protein [candidate division KSB1 bacterium]
IANKILFIITHGCSSFSRDTFRLIPIGKRLLQGYCGKAKLFDFRSSADWRRCAIGAFIILDH